MDQERKELNTLAEEIGKLLSEKLYISAKTGEQTGIRYGLRRPQGYYSPELPSDQLLVWLAAFKAGIMALFSSIQRCVLDQEKP